MSRVFVIALIEEQESICRYLEQSSLGRLSLGRNVICLEETEKEIDFTDQDYFVITKDKGNKLLKIKERIKDKLYIWFCQKMIRYGDFDAIEHEEKKAIQYGKWLQVKAWNELKNSMDYYEKNIELHGLPQCLQIETCSYCNARCIMCPHFYKENKEARLLDIKVLEKLDSVLPYCKNIVLHGNGEPLLHPEIEELLCHYKKYGIHFMMNSNFSYLPSFFLEQANQCFDTVNISCDGSNARIYEGIRAGLNFNQFVENVKKFRRKNPDLKMIMSTVAMRQNIFDVEDLVCFAHELGFDEIHFGMLGSDSIIGNQRDELKYYPNITKVNMRKAVKAGKDLDIKVKIPKQCMEDSDIDEKELLNEKQIIEKMAFYKFNNNLAEWTAKEINKNEKLKCMEYKKIISCMWPFHNVRIDAEGNVGICCKTSDYTVRNLLDAASFKEIWNGEIYKKIRLSFYKGESLLLCEGCDCQSN